MTVLLPVSKEIVFYQFAKTFPEFRIFYFFQNYVDYLKENTRAFLTKMNKVNGMVAIDF